MEVNAFDDLVQIQVFFGKQVSDPLFEYGGIEMDVLVVGDVVVVFHFELPPNVGITCRLQQAF